MKMVKQEFTHDPSTGVYGDCHRACIATVLEMERLFVPHFGWDGPSTEVFWKRVQNFLKLQNLREVTVAYNYSSFNKMREYIDGYLMESSAASTPIIIGGMSERGVMHSIVYKDGAIINDPARADGKDDETVLRPTEEGVFFLSFLVPLDYARMRV